MMLSGRMDIRAVAMERTLESKVMDGGAYATGPLEAVPTVVVLDRYDCQYAVPQTRSAPTACKARLDAHDATVTSWNKPVGNITGDRIALEDWVLAANLDQHARKWRD